MTMGFWNLSVVHAMELGGVIDNLVETEAEKIAEHHFDDGSPTTETQTVTDAYNRGFANRGVQHTVGNASDSPRVTLNAPPYGERCLPR